MAEGASAAGVAEGASAAGVAEGASAVELEEGVPAVELEEGAPAVELKEGAPAVEASAAGVAEAPTAATLLLSEVTVAEGLVLDNFLCFFPALSSAKLPEVTVAEALGKVACLVKLLALALLLALWADLSSDSVKDWMKGGQVGSYLQESGIRARPSALQCQALFSTRL